MARSYVGGPGSDDSGQYHLGAWLLPKEEKPSERLLMRDFLAGPTPTGPAAYKPQGPLNQGQTPECVGHDGRNWLLATPDPQPWDANADTAVPDDDAQKLYALAQRFDGIPGRHEGSTNHGLVAALRQLGYITGNVVWASGPDDVLAWIRQQGPVMFGSQWDHSMFKPDEDGFIAPDGNRAGGHSYLLFACDEDDNVYLWQSWGQWGVGGDFIDKPSGEPFSLTTGVAKLSKPSLQTLFDEGDAEGVSPLKVDDTSLLGT